MDEFISGRRPMISGIGEASKRVYKKAIDKKDKNRIWLYAAQDNPADNIYVGYPYDTKSQGFCGRWMEFKLEDNTTVRLQGPWHSGPNALKENTGIDLTDKHLTYGCVSLSREDSYQGIFMQDRYYDLLHADTDWTLGEFNRIDNLAQSYANKLGKTIYYYQESRGGSSAGVRKPKS